LLFELGGIVDHSMIPIDDAVPVVGNEKAAVALTNASLAA